MSWLGGGFSSLTDQITNFTKEVLTEGREEVSDHVTELNIANRRIQELEVQCTTYRQEIERIRRRNSELDERCQATELQINSVSSQYRTLLQQKEDEIQALKQKHHDLLEPGTDAAPTSPTTSGSTLFRFHGDDEADLGDLITSQLEINRLAAEVRKLRAERDHWKHGAAPEQADNEQNGEEKRQLMARIKELEKSLHEATDLNHHQVVALQDHYEQRLAEVQQSQQARIAGLQKQLQSYHQGVSESTPEGELQRLQNHAEESDKKLEEERRKVEELRREQRDKEKTLQLLTRQIDKLQSEKIQLNKELKTSATKLEELQHVQKQDVKVEKNVEKKPQRLSAVSSDGVQGSVDEQITTNQVIQDIQDTRTKLATGAANIKSQLIQDRQDIVDQMLETEKQKIQLKGWLGMLEGEKKQLSKEIKSLICSLGKRELLGYINALEEENTVLKNQNKETEIQMPEADRILSLRPEPLGESSSDTPVHSSRVSQTTVGPFSTNEADAVSELSARNKQLSEEIKVLQLQVETCEQEIEQLQWALAEQKNFGDEFPSEGNGKSGLQVENDNLREKLSVMEQLNEELQHKLQSSESHVLLKQTRLEEQDSHIHELVEEKLALEISLEELDTQHQEAMEKILLVKKELVETNKHFTTENQVLKEKCHSQEEQISFLKMENETVQEQYLTLAKKIRQETDTSHSNDDTEVSTPPLKSIMEAVNSINADNLELEEKMSALEAQRKDMEVKLLKAETLSQENKVEKDLMEKELLSLKALFETLQTSLEEANTLKEEEKVARESVEEECSSLRVQLKEMQSIVLEKDSDAEQQGSDAELVARVQELTSENENLQNEADDLWTRMIATSHELESLNLEIGNLQLANRKLQEELENVQVQCQQEIQRVEDKMEKLEKTSARQHDEDKQKLEVLQREKTILQEELDAVVVRKREEIQVIEKNIEDLERTLAKVQEDSRIKQVALEQEITKLLAAQEDSVEDVCESDQVTKCIEQPNRQIAEYVAQIDSLEKELIDLKNERTHSAVNSVTEAKVQTTYLDLKYVELLIEEKNLTIEKLQNELKASMLEVEDLSSEIEHLKLNAKFQEKENINTIENVDSCTSLETKNINDLMNALKQKTSEISLLNSKVELLRKMVNSEAPCEDNQMEQKLRCLEMEREQMLSVMNEKSRECSNLKTEVHRLVSVVAAEKQALSKLQQDNQELVKQRPPDQEMSKEAVQRLSRIVKDKEIEIEALQQKNQTLLQFIQQSTSGSECLETLLQEKEQLNKQVLTYQSEREQIITILQQKHQESLQYHGEVQRLNSILSTESQKYDSLQQQYQSVSQSFEEKQKILINTQNELVALKARVSELERQHLDLRQKYIQILEKDPEIVQVRKEEYVLQVTNLEQLSSNLKESETLIHEKDRLIYDLNREVREAREETVRKEETLYSLQNRLDNSGFQLNEAQRQVVEAGHGSENLRKDLDRLQEECTMLKETNRNLSMMIKQAEFEKNTMQEKVETMTQILKQQNSESADMQTMLENREALEKQAQNLHQEWDQTVLALSQKQAENAELQAELSKSQEHSEKLKKELDRLRHHLIEVQENYTQEALLAEDREKTLRNRLAQAEEKASVSSTAIMNASQQANIQVESLQKQVSKLAQEREHALQMVSQLEDRVQEQAAGTTNLQLALEQIQRDQKRELRELKKQQQSLLEQEHEKRRELEQKLVAMKNQLTETSVALDAASRLSEQLDRKEELITALKEEVSTRDHNLQKAMEAMKELQSHTEGKVDKQVMKSLVLGYFGSANAQKPEVVRLLARVLDFSRDEMNKVGLKLGKDVGEEKPSGWLSWIVRSSPSTKPQVSTAPAITDESFTAKFVQFLQEESQPRPQIRLPIEAMTKRPSGPSIQIPTNERPSTIPSTNPTTMNFSNHLLLKPISTSLPTFAPLVIDGASKSNSSSNFLQEVLNQT